MLVSEREIGRIENTRAQYNQAQVEQALRKLSENVSKEQNDVVAGKISECINKWNENQLNIGFCGHFSAGKSTMINQLLRQDLLPSSPIPTSANVVTIAFGEPKAIIHFVDGRKITIPLAEVEHWQEYCVDGRQVERVNIFVESPLLEGGLQFLDTPGIDSTDEAHQAATEEALHLADVIIFVTDYNHVQSETNFYFIKSLLEKGKTLFLVINQIDKHREQELSLSKFQERVKAGLREWGIKLDGLLFTSLKNPTHPYNQFDQLVKLFDQLKGIKKELVEEHLVHALAVLLEEHGDFLRDKQREERELLCEQLEQLREQSNYTENPHLLTQFRQSEKVFSSWQKEIEEEMQKIMGNAIITPYVTTQKAQALIESHQQDFKMGWLFAKKKTEAERQHRLEALYSDIVPRVEAQIEWHVKELLRKKAEEYQLHDQNYLAKLMDWSLTVPKEWLLELIKRDIVSREFVYQYTKELTKKIHFLYRQHILELVKPAEELFCVLHQERFGPLDAKLSIYQEIESIESQLAQLDREIAEQIEVYQDGMKNILGVNEERRKWQLEEILLTENDEKRDIEQGILNEQKWLSTPASRSRQELLFNKHNLSQTAAKLEGVAQLIEPLPSLHSLRLELIEKARRLRQNKFTICLFGAFSAGKSSFANALLGSPVLPVSPNPTTAAINQVLPATAEHPAGTALIKMKSRAQVEEEIRHSLQRLHLPVSGQLAKDLQQIRTVEAHQLRTSLKPYYSFISACQKGFEDAEAKFGAHFKVDEKEFKDYVAVEHKACFVESIQLFHDSYLISQGMEIIDTPGADSIYSRHTNVTFNYIKHADVILYITYYNHAFSRADRQFLDQLGRVKDQFALDKMFFLVNAADLAKSEEELEDVLKHVEQNLLQSGIRFPRIFPISSLRAIQGEQDSGMEEFEQDFLQFIQEDVSSLLVESAEREIDKAYSLLKEMLEQMQASTQKRKDKMGELRALEEKWLQTIEADSYPSFLKELEKEIKEHIYYVRQRLFFNFQALFHEAFHPSILTAELNAKEQLPLCLDELLFSLLFQLKEEFAATSLRLENFIYRQLGRIHEQWQRNLEQESILLSAHLLEKVDLGIPQFKESFDPLNKQELERSLRHFKSPKQFFEQEGKEMLRQELVNSLPCVVDDYLQQNEEIFQEFYVQAWYLVEAAWQGKIKEELQLAVAARLSALRGELSAQELSSIIVQYEEQMLN